jgi:hypothetical protein
MFEVFGWQMWDNSHFIPLMVSNKGKFYFTQHIILAVMTTDYLWFHRMVMTTVGYCWEEDRLSLKVDHFRVTKIQLTTLSCLNFRWLWPKHKDLHAFPKPGLLSFVDYK